MEKRLPLGIQDFKKLIDGNCLYIDKTHLIPTLRNKYTYAFLARPRRFGKSLFVSTLKEYFLGNKELFKGLAIYDDTEWIEYPVIRLDFSNVATDDDLSFKKSLLHRLESFATEYNVSPIKDDLNEYFSSLIEQLYKKLKRKVVILIDEYDKPLTDQLDNPDLEEKLRNILRSFFIRMKGNDEYIEFVFLTGVSKFSKVSLFSGMNQVSDITLDEDFASLLGYTQSELEFYFKDHFKNLMEKLDLTKEQVLAKTKKWYNGYSWNGVERVYNPFSILSLFQMKRFSNYWFGTGTPQLLLKLISDYKFDISQLRDTRANKFTFETKDLSEVTPENYLFQTGYLTIKERIFRNEEEEFILDFPNYEVEESLYTYLFSGLTNSRPDHIKIKSNALNDSLENGDLEKFKLNLEYLFAQIPSNLYIAEERFYHSLFIMILYLSGVEVDSEVNTNIGRIDGVIEFSNKIYIIELKYNKPPEEGIEQILQKKYYQKYLGKGKSLHLIGVGFTRQKIEIIHSIMPNT